MIGCTISVDEVAIKDQEDQLPPSHRTADIPHVTPASVRYRPEADIVVNSNALRPTLGIKSEVFPPSRFLPRRR